MDWPTHANKDFPPWSHVVLVEDDDGVRVLTAGAEFHGRYQNPGPRQNQEHYAKLLAERYEVPTGSKLHILTPTNDPGESYCSHLTYVITRSVQVRVAATVKKQP